MAHQHAGLRQQLVAELRRQGFIKSGLVADAFTSVPRHLFAPDVPPEEAYANKVIPLKSEDNRLTSSLSQPTMMAIMLEALDLQPGMSILEIGTGSGYNAALISQIVGRRGRVVTLDIEADLVAAAQNNLEAAGYHSVLAVAGDGAEGFPRYAPYDGIIATAAVPDVTASWWSQLAPDGRIALPLVLVGNHQVFATFQRRGDELVSNEISSTAFIRLRGRHQGDGFRRAPLGPRKGVFVRFTQAPALNQDDLYKQLRSTAQTHPLGVKVNQEELRFGLLPWLYLHEPALLHLIAKEPAGAFVPQLLKEREQGLRSTLLLCGRQGSATLGAKPRVTARLGLARGPDSPRRLTLQIYQHGADISAARRLAGLINAWERRGKPGLDKMHIRAVPMGSPIEPPAGALTLDKPDSRFFIFWA